MTIRISPRLAIVAAIILGAGIAYGVYAAIIATEERPTGTFRVAATPDLVVKTYRVESGTVTEDNTSAWCGHEGLVDGSEVKCVIGMTQHYDASTTVTVSVMDVDTSDGLGLAGKLQVRVKGSSNNKDAICTEGGFVPVGALDQIVDPLFTLNNPAAGEERFVCLSFIYLALPGEEPAPDNAETSATFRVELDNP